MIVLFPGLGADEKLFDPYDFEGKKIFFIKFLPPQENETFHEYCLRIASTIPKDDDLIFIGVSFGGLMAQEISKMIAVKKIILISSIKSDKEQPRYFSWVKFFPWYRAIPASPLKKIGVLLSTVLTRRSKKERSIFLSFVKEADARVIRFGIIATLNWSQQQQLPNVIHIHGSRDMVFPIKRVKPDYVIRGGSHFMIIRRAEEINALLSRLLDE